MSARIVHYEDDGKGLANVFPGIDPRPYHCDSIMAGIQSWRDDHPDRFNRIVTVIAGKYSEDNGHIYLDNVIIVYRPTV